MYGGILEQGERSYTLNDLWTIDVKKLDKWKQLVVCEGMDWQGSDDGESQSQINKSNFCFSRSRK